MFSKAIKDTWNIIVDFVKSIKWNEIWTKIVGFAKEHPWVVIGAIIFLLFIIILSSISEKRKNRREIEKAFSSNENDELLKEIFGNEEYINTSSEAYEPIEEVNQQESDDIDYEKVLEKLLEEKKNEIKEAVIVNKQQEAIIERDTRIESLLMELLDIKNNGLNSNVAREMLGEAPINKGVVEPIVVKENNAKPEVIVPKIEINIPSLVVQEKDKVEEVAKIDNEVKPKDPEPIIEEPTTYSKPINLNPINYEKIEVVQVASSKKYGVDNMNTNRLGIVFTDDEIRNTIKD